MMPGVFDFAHEESEMKKRFRAGLLLGALSVSAGWTPSLAQTASPEKPVQRGTTQADPLFGVSIPYEEFRLPNGLRVIVQTDHAAPVVAVNIWYHVGSRNEPTGRTGFAHLFEHLMFQGSENYRDEYFRPFELVGTTDRNGSTAFDRTNYYQTVPTPALDLALWMESDRMGHLLGAIDQKTLDEQRGVVQNEKRQRYGQPYGLVMDRLYGAVFPAGHPYHHLPIGSMADLEAASLGDVKGWFKSWYGPNNATLVLSGDIDLATAKEKVTKYFGDIAPSATIAPAGANVPKHLANTRELFPDKVPHVAIYRAWAAPGARDPDSMPAQILARILGGSMASRLRARLVQKDEVATDATAGLQEHELAGMFVVAVTLRDGVNPTKVEGLVDEEIRRLIHKGPSADEIDRVRASLSTAYINTLPRASNRADLLNQCATYTGRPDCWKDDLAALAAATPESLRAVAERWLSRGSHTIVVTRSDTPAAAGPETAEPVVKRTAMIVPPADPRFKALPTGVDRASGPPKVTELPNFKLPPLQRATLSNGMQVVLIERHSAPLVSLALTFPSGAAAQDIASGAPGTRAEMAIQMLLRGAGAYDALGLSARMEQLGISILPSLSREFAGLIYGGKSSNLAEGLDLLGDVLLRPTFDANELERLRRQNIAGVQAKRSSAGRAIGRVLPSLLYGADHPFGQVANESDYANIRREDLVAFMQQRMDPKGALVAVAGDTTLAEIVPLLEARLGAWKGPQNIPTVAIPDVAVPSKPRVYLIDQPGVPQSSISVAQIVPQREDDLASDALEMGDSVLGGNFTSRLNMNLREDKHWSYGAGSGFGQGDKGQRFWRATASVQTDRTADSMREMLNEILGLDRGDKPATDLELEKIKANLYALPSTFESNFTNVGAILSLVSRGLPDDYYLQYMARVRAITTKQATDAFGDTIDPNALTWVVMGPLDKIEAPIRALNLGEVTVIDADGKRIR